MNIQIRTDGCTLFLPVPNGVAFSSLTARIAGWAVEKYAPEVTLSAQQLQELMRAARHCARENPRLVLVEVDSAQGDHVRITL